MTLGGAASARQRTAPPQAAAAAEDADAARRTRRAHGAARHYPDPIHEPAAGPQAEDADAFPVGRVIAPVDARPQAPPSRVSLLVAPPDALTAAEARLILDAIARHEDVLMICGDNRLDAYGLLARARSLGLENAVADGVLLARAFTVHQFAALLETTLPRMSEGRVAGLALVTGIMEPFLDEDVRPAEARTLLARVLRSLGTWSQSAGVPLVLSHSQVRATGAAGQLATMIEDATAGHVQIPTGTLRVAQKPIEAWGAGASKWTQAEPSASKWSQAEPSASKWSQAEPSASKWVHVAPRGRTRRRGAV